MGRGTIATAMNEKIRIAFLAGLSDGCSIYLAGLTEVLQSEPQGWRWQRPARYLNIYRLCESSVRLR
jgi:hypothetical protein